jgi:hypothetical protein
MLIVMVIGDLGFGGIEVATQYKVPPGSPILAGVNGFGSGKPPGGGF